MDPALKSAWQSVQGKLLFPIEGKHPYYISAPRWMYSSAGIRALHLLCHTLNRSGFEAYILHHPHEEYRRPWINPELIAPMLDEQQAKKHFEAGICPILVYSEIISGNPVNAPFVTRWIMNFPGLLGGDTHYDNDEICFGYSRELAVAAGSPDRVLHMPTIDTRIFCPQDESIERKGSCFCASKYKEVHNGELDPITDESFEITRWLPDSLTPPEVAALLRRSEVFYTYENTALATEAVLCGCPAVFIPNDHLTAMIGQNEIGTDGFAWGTDPESIQRARATVNQGAINYLKTYDLFWEQFNSFIAITQERARRTPYTQMITVPNWPAAKGLRGYFQRLRKEMRRFARKIRHT